MDTRGTKWMAYMRAGSFEQAWRVSDQVLAERAGQSCQHLPLSEQWLWNGESLGGRSVLVRCHHGLGDTIQFIRYISLVRRVARRVTLLAQPAVLPLLRTMTDLPHKIRALSAGVSDYEVAVEVMELPYILRTTVTTIPADVPYFRVEPAQLPKTEGFNVGLVWAAGDWDDRRSIPFALIQQLTTHPRVRWHILQRGNALKQWAGAFGRNAGDDDVLATARLIAGLDLLISVDTLPAHLGGALAVPTWTLLHAKADWRWMSGRHDSPWYPTMRLFRQRKMGEWQTVIDEVREKLGDCFRRRRLNTAKLAFR